jgi:hypothetical protein
MKMHYIFLLIFLMLVSIALGQQPVKMADILNTVRQQGHLKDPEIAISAEKIIAGSTNLEEVGAAKMLLAQSLADSGSHRLNADALERARTLWEEELRDSPSSWEGQLARFNLIADLGTQGSNSAIIVSAQDALKDMNFDILENSSSPVLKTLRQLFGDRPNLFREGMKLALANALCNELRIAEARNVFDTITDPEYKNIIQSRIVLAEKSLTEKEHLAAEHLKSAPGSVP